jgi:hypothetical protein
MTIDEVNDDYGLAKQPFRVVACIPVFGRGSLVELTIKRLYQKNNIYKVVCAGSEPEDKQICESAGAVWVQHRNRPLGLKWNAAFHSAKQFNPDACVFVGSSDWLSDNWIPTLRPYLNEYDLVGVPGMHLLHVCEEPLLCEWEGYTNTRKGESIGIGRILSRRLLDKMHFRPFNDHLDNSLDASMHQNSSRHAARIHLVDNKNIIALSLSTNLWENKHKFWEHYSGQIHSKRMYNVDEFIQNHFPEAKILCESLKGTLVNR